MTLRKVTDRFIYLKPTLTEASLFFKYNVDFEMDTEFFPSLPALLCFDFEFLVKVWSENRENKKKVKVRKV